MTKDGVIVIHAQRFRTQERNKADAIERLVELLREAAFRQAPRRPTKPTLGSKIRRLDGKKRRSDVKAGAAGRGFDDWTLREQRGEIARWPAAPPGEAA